jgi:hypothetical protein
VYVLEEFKSNGSKTTEACLPCLVGGGGGGLGKEEINWKEGRKEGRKVVVI